MRWSSSRLSATRTSYRIDTALSKALNGLSDGGVSHRRRCTRAVTSPRAKGSASSFAAATASRAYKHVDRSIECADHPADVLGAGQAGGVEHVGAGLLRRLGGGRDTPDGQPHVVDRRERTLRSGTARGCLAQWHRPPAGGSLHGDRYSWCRSWRAGSAGGLAAGAGVPASRRAGPTTKVETAKTAAKRTSISAGFLQAPERRRIRNNSGTMATSPRVASRPCPHAPRSSAPPATRPMWWMTCGSVPVTAAVTPARLKLLAFCPTERGPAEKPRWKRWRPVGLGVAATGQPVAPVGAGAPAEAR
jgi:hypothetical protein